MGAMQPIHWIIVLLVVLLLFGAKKLPDAARGLGRSMRIFKSEMKEMQSDGEQPQAQQPAQLTQAQPQAAGYPTGAATAQATQGPATAPVQHATAGQAPGTVPPPPQPVWDPETQQYVLPNQQPGQNPQAQ